MWTEEELEDEPAIEAGANHDTAEIGECGKRYTMGFITLFYL